MSLARSPYFLTLDVVLLAGILIHGLNGLRVALTGFEYRREGTKGAVRHPDACCRRRARHCGAQDLWRLRAMENPFAQEPKATSSWLWQVITGVGLVHLARPPYRRATFHRQRGLRDFAEVLAYLRNPIFLVLEVLFLVVVATHAMLGVRAILLDFGLSARAEKRLSQALTVVGVLTVGYGLW